MEPEEAELEPTEESGSSTGGDAPGTDTDTGVGDWGGEEELPRVCELHAACFSWCGTEFIDGRCFPASEVVLEPEALGPVLCEPVILDVGGGVVSRAAGVTNEAVRCFLQVLRYGHEGVAELRWMDGGGRTGRLLVGGRGGQYARLEMRLSGVEPACGDAITLSAPMAHVRAERDPHFDGCLDVPGDVELDRCLLGPATTFFEGHDWVYEVAFPWLSGTCGVS